jgi:hypothetical protein
MSAGVIILICLGADTDHEQSRKEHPVVGCDRADNAYDLEPLYAERPTRRALGGSQIQSCRSGTADLFDDFCRASDLSAPKWLDSRRCRRSSGMRPWRMLKGFRGSLDVLD